MLFKILMNFCTGAVLGGIGCAIAMYLGHKKGTKMREEELNK